jgi:hypothetical protein
MNAGTEVPTLGDFILGFNNSSHRKKIIGAMPY